MSTLLQLRRGTAAAWQAANPILHAGEVGVELDSGPRAKIGDGVTAWASVPYLDATTFTGGAPGALAMRDPASVNGFAWLPSAAGVLVSDGDDEVPVFRPLVAGDIPPLAYAPVFTVAGVSSLAKLVIGSATPASALTGLEVFNAQSLLGDGRPLGVPPGVIVATDTGVAGNVNGTVTY